MNVISIIDDMSKSCNRNQSSNTKKSSQETKAHFIPLFLLNEVKTAFSKHIECAFTRMKNIIMSITKIGVTILSSAFLVFFLLSPEVTLVIFLSLIAFFLLAFFLFCIIGMCVISVRSMNSTINSLPSEKIEIMKFLNEIIHLKNKSLEEDQKNQILTILYKTGDSINEDKNNKIIAMENIRQAISFVSSTTGILDILVNTYSLLDMVKSVTKLFPNNENLTFPDKLLSILKNMKQSLLTVKKDNPPSTMLQKKS